jgi:DNA-directed RNA polymerase specialized sigma24 family protein
VLRIMSRALGSVDPAVIHDLEQELYVRLLANDCEALRGLREQDASSIRAFLCVTALNLARDQRRRQGVRRIIVSGDLTDMVGEHPSHDEPLDQTYERTERLQMVLDEVAKQLKGSKADRDLLIFRAHFSDGLSASEIAGMGVELTPKGVETVLFRLIGRVREALRARGEDAA